MTRTASIIERMDGMRLTPERNSAGIGFWMPRGSMEPHGWYTSVKRATELSYIVARKFSTLKSMLPLAAGTRQARSPRAHVGAGSGVHVVTKGVGHRDGHILQAEDDRDHNCVQRGGDRPRRGEDEEVADEEEREEAHHDDQMEVGPRHRLL